MQTLTVADAVAAIPTLQAVLPNLSQRDQVFARDLISYKTRKGYVTPGQAPWVGKLIARADTNKEPNTDAARAESLGDATGIKALFDRAACHLKAPAVVIQVPDVGLVRVYVGKEGARRYAGRTVVADYDKPWPQGKTYGVINPDGMFEPKKFVEIPPTLLDTLKDFAADPVKHARAYGKLTGRCCFCRLPLTDERSTAQGYGKICADHFQLPWGERPAADTVFLASDTAPDQGTMDMAGLETPEAVR